MAPDNSSVCPSPFDSFDKFAAQIYATRPVTPYLWPALYGCEANSGRKYEVLFVFKTALPRLDLWRTKWPPNSECGSHIHATWTHRRIFFDWARSSPSKQLFELFGSIDWALSTDLFSEEHRSIMDFYKRFYITDVWKDHTPEPKDYWRCALNVELRCVATQCVIFVGNAATTEGRRLLRGRNPDYDVYDVRFPISEPKPKDNQPPPSIRSKENFEKYKASLDKLRERLIKDHRIPG
jgi:hypothetical protein